MANKVKKALRKEVRRNTVFFVKEVCKDSNLWQRIRVAELIILEGKNKRMLKIGFAMIIIGVMTFAVLGYYWSIVLKGM